MQDGGKGYYSDNTAIFEGFTARAYIGNGLTALTAGEYHAIGSTDFTLLSYTVKYVTNGATISVQNDTAATAELDYNKNGVKYATETVEINQAMNGAWAAGEAPAAEHNVTVVNETYYDASDGERTKVEDAVVQNGTLTFTVQTLDGAYTHLARVQVGEGEAVTVTPDADGIYTITDVNDDVTITVTSVLKGDANLDSKVNIGDVVLLRRFMAGKADFEKSAELQRLAINVVVDEKINMQDLVMLRKFLSGKITEL